MVAADRSRNVPPGGLAALLNTAREHGAVDLAVGTPRWPEPDPELIEHACAALRAGHNQYEHPDGNVELRTRLAESLGAPGIAPDPLTELTVVVGGTEGLAVALLSVVDPGDEVVVLEPCYEGFLGAIALAGGRPRLVRTSPPGWGVDLEALAAAFGPRTKAIVLNSPGNPAGHVLSRQELDAVADLCERWNVTAVADEVYSAYVYGDQPHVSVADVPGLTERSIVIGSLSKSHAISGWRVGFLRANSALTAVLRKVHIATTAGAPAPFQHAVARAGILGTDRWRPAEQMRRHRDRAVAIFTGIGLRCAMPDGGCYLMADITAVTGEGSDEFARRLVTGGGVAVVPGGFFFGDPRDGTRFVRIAFNRPDETFDEVERRLARSPRRWS